MATAAGTKAKDRRTVQLPIDEHRQIKMDAAALDLSMGEFVVRAARAYAASQLADSRPARPKRRRAVSA